MFEVFALSDAAAETLACRIEFAESGVRDAAEVKGVGRAPGVSALGFDRVVERCGAWRNAALQSLRVLFGARQGQAQLDHVMPEFAVACELTPASNSLSAKS